MPYDKSKTTIQLEPTTRKALRVFKAKMDLPTYDATIRALLLHAEIPIRQKDAMLNE